jgi:YVTN family beta-propeller protein
MIIARAALAADSFPKAYAAEFGASSVAVIDTKDNQVLEHIPLPKGVHGLIVLPDGSRVLVSSDESSVISVIDTSNDKVIGQIPTGKAPHGLAVSRDGQHVFAAIFGDNQVVEINSKSLKIERTFDVPSPHNIAVSNDTKTIYAADQEASKTGIAKIDISNGKMVQLVPTDKVPRSLNLSPDGTALTVTQFDHDDVQVYSINPFQLLTSIDVGQAPHHTIFTPNGKLVLVCNQVTNDVTLIDAKTWKVAGKIEVGKKPHWIAPSSDSEYAYVTDEASNEVSFVDLEEKKVEATINVAAGPRKIAIQPGKISEMDSDEEMEGMMSESKTGGLVQAKGVDANDSVKKASGKHVTILMQGPPQRFEPSRLEIEAGTTVEWVNQGTKVHTVTAENKDWDSGSLGPGEKFSKEFDQKGTFKYYCIPHRDIGMIGTIVVK